MKVLCISAREKKNSDFILYCERLKTIEIDLFTQSFVLIFISFYRFSRE